MQMETVKCAKCGTLYNVELINCPKCNNDMIICPHCYKWYRRLTMSTTCPKCKKDTTYFCNSNNEDYVENNKNNCIICGNESNGYLFCKNCYYKFKNKSIYLKITNCEKIELLNTMYESNYTCEDGHPVKSQQEALIDNYLFNHNIRHVYEKAFPIDNNKEHDLHPDFYLPDLDVYIEHWGIKNNVKYEETKEYKIPFYKKAKITLICTNSDDITNISANLERKLKFFEKGKINWLE